MADRFWIGDSGDWNDANHWSDTSGGSGPQPAPTTSDNVYFDANSFSIASQTVTLNVSAEALIVDWRGVSNNPTFTGTNSLSIGDNISSGLYFDNSMSVSVTGAINIFGAGNVDTQNKSIGELNIGSAGANIVVNLDSAITATSLAVIDSEFSSFSKAITLTGAFNIFANNFNVTLGTSAISAGDMSIITSLGTDGTITGTPTINISSSFTISKNGDLTYNMENAPIILGTAATVFTGGDQTFNNVTLNGGTTTISSNNTFGTLSIADGKTVKFTTGSTTTLGVLDATGSSGSLISIQSTNSGTAFTLSKSSGTVNVDYINIKDSTAEGGATFIAGMEGYDKLGNTGWTFIRNDYLSKDVKPHNEIEIEKAKNKSVINLKSIESEIIDNTPKFKYDN